MKIFYRHNLALVPLLLAVALLVACGQSVEPESPAAAEPTMAATSTVPAPAVKEPTPARTSSSAPATRGCRERWNRTTRASRGRRRTVPVQ